MIRSLQVSLSLSPPLLLETKPSHTTYYDKVSRYASEGITITFLGTRKSATYVTEVMKDKEKSYTQRECV